MDTHNIIAPATTLSITIPHKTSIILILNIEANAKPLHELVIGSCTHTNIIKPITLTTLSFLARPSIFVSIHIITLLKYFLYLK